MVRKTIPAETIINCDRCGKQCDCSLSSLHSKTKSMSRMNTTVIVKRSALDALGDPVANGSFTVDLCDECSNELYDFVYGNDE